MSNSGGVPGPRTSMTTTTSSSIPGPTAQARQGHLRHSVAGDSRAPFKPNVARQPLTAATGLKRASLVPTTTSVAPANRFGFGQGRRTSGIENDNAQPPPRPASSLGTASSHLPISASASRPRSSSVAVTAPNAVDYRQKYEAAQKELEQLKQQAAQHDPELAEARKASSSVNPEDQGASEHHETATRERLEADWGRKLAEALDKVESLQDQLQATDESHQKAIEQHELSRHSMETENVQLRSTVDELRAACSNALQQLDGASSLQASLDESRDIIARLEDTCSQQERQLQEVRSELELVKQDREAAKQLRTVHDNLRVELQSVSSQNSELNNRLLDELNAKTSIEAELKRYAAQLEQSTHVEAELRASVEKTKSELKTAHEANERSCADSLELARSLDQAHASLQATENRVSELQNQVRMNSADRQQEVSAWRNAHSIVTDERNSLVRTRGIRLFN